MCDNRRRYDASTLDPDDDSVSVASVLTDAIQLTRHMAARLRDRGGIPIRTFEDVRAWLAANRRRARYVPSRKRNNAHFFVIPAGLAAPLVLVVVRTPENAWCVATVLGGNAPETWTEPARRPRAPLPPRKRNPRRRRHQEPPEFSDS